MYTNQFHLDHIVFENGPLFLEERIEKVKGILQWVKKFELDLDLNNFIFAYLCDQSMATHFKELNIKQHGKGKSFQDIHALEKSFRNSYTSSRHHFENLDAHTLRILQHNFKGKSLKEWMTILNRYFIHRASLFCSDVVLKRVSSNSSEQFWCHKLLLVSRNSYFRTLILGNFIESSHYKATENSVIEIECDSDHLLDTFVSFLYSDQKPAYSNAFLLLPLAKRYLEEALVNECEDVLRYKVDSKNALELFFFAIDWNLPKLLEECKSRLAIELSIMNKMDYSSVMNCLLETNQIDFARDVEISAMQLEFQNETQDFCKYLAEDLRVYLLEARKNQLFPVEIIDEENGICSDCPFCKQNLWQRRKQQPNVGDSKHYMSYYSHFVKECEAFEKDRMNMVMECAKFTKSGYYNPPMLPHIKVDVKKKTMHENSIMNNSKSDVVFYMFTKLDYILEHHEKLAIANFLSTLIQKLLSFTPNTST